MNLAHHLRSLILILRKELGSFRITPTLYVCLALFTFLAAYLHFWMGGYLKGDTAALGRTFFRWHPWLYCLFAPAISMRLWSEEYRQKTLEFLIPTGFRHWHLLVGKFLSVWIILALALALTFPVVITAAKLGDPDLGTIACAYLGSFLIAGYFSAIASSCAAITSNQFIAYMLGATISTLLLIFGSPKSLNTLIDFMPGMADSIIHLSKLSILTQFQDYQRGLFTFSSLASIIFSIILFLWLTHSYIHLKKSPHA